MKPNLNFYHLIVILSIYKASLPRNRCPERIGFYKGYRIIINMADGAFQILIQNMSRLGFFNFLFPFLLALAIVYGLITWALKDQLPKSARGLISLIIAFFVMLYSSWNTMIVDFFANISGQFTVVATGLLFIAMLIAITGYKPKDLLENKTAKWVTVLVLVFIGIVIFFGAGAMWLINVPGWTVSPEVWAVLFFIVILAIVMFFLGQEEGGGAPAEKKEGG